MSASILSHSGTSRKQLRQQLRARRRRLSPRHQRQAAQLLCRQVLRHGLIQSHRDIAFYLANDGEINPALLLQRLQQMNKRCYLPVLEGQQLVFVRYRPGDRMTPNRFGIPEPADQHERCRPEDLDMVFMPLVGFDRQGGRLGMGGGFYDRSFSALKQHPCSRHPVLIGLAHQCQQVDQLKLQSWDIPLSKVVTDKMIFDCAQQ